MSYELESQKPSSKKYTLAWIEPSEKLVLWDAYSGSIYNRTVSHFVTMVSEDGTQLIEASSTALSSGEWYFDNKTLYVRTSDDTTPQAKFMVADYRLFFSNHPINLEWDLDSGFDVYYDGSLKPVGAFAIGLDYEQMGQAIESSGSISFTNDEFWKDNFDTLIWENKPVKLFSKINRDTEIKTVFEGEVTGKSYSSTSIRLSVKDPLHKLRSFVSADLYSDSDGTISKDIIGTPKRVVYGLADGIQMQGLDQVVDGYDLTGTISVTADATSLVGIGTEFLKELSPDDELTFSNQFGDDFSYRVESISGDSTAAITEESEETTGGATATVQPEINYRYKNRSFQISGHKLREPTTTASVNATQLNRLEVADKTDFLIDDSISVGSETATIKRISGDTFVLSQNLDTLPTTGVAVTKKPVTAVYFNAKNYLIDRDFSITNTSSSCKITMEDDAEFNVTTPKVLSGTITFTGSSRDVSGSGSSFTSVLKPRDWIISDDITHQIYYEILSITDDENLKLRTAYAGSNNTGAAKRKNIKYIGDDSTVTCDCIGKENSSGEWVKTPSDAVRDLLAIGGITNIDTASFTASDIDAPYIVSLALPLVKTAGMPAIKTAISYINNSCFGSLVNRSDFKLAFSILSPDRPLASAGTVADDDILSFSVSAKLDTFNKIIGKYRHQDNERYSGEASSLVYEFESEFVEYLVRTEKEKEVEIYLYNANDAETMVQRYAFFHSLAQQVIKITGGGLGLSKWELNDKVYLDLNKLYKRFGGTDCAKIVIVNSIKRSGKEYNIEVNDLGNYFSRVGAIADDSTNDFASASSSEKILSGFVVDNDTELPGATESESSTNLIG